MISSISGTEPGKALVFPSLLTGSEGRMPPATVDPSITNVAVSSNALTISNFLDAANAFVRSEHIETFGGYDRGRVSLGAYLDVSKYNDYIFDSAATSMLKQAAGVGIALDKDEVISALRVSNSSIENLRNDEAVRVANLGAGSVLASLTADNMMDLTDMYIAAKEKGLDTDQVAVVAARLGMANKDAATGVVTVVYDPEKETSGYMSTSGEAAADSADPFSQFKQALYGKLGLPTSLINLLVDSVKVGNTEANQTLTFLRGLLAQ